MSNRSLSILALATAIALLWIYCGVAQVPSEKPKTPRPQDGALVIDSSRDVGYHVAGRYQLDAVAGPTGTLQIIVLDTYSGQCWVRGEQAERWTTWGSPIEQKPQNGND